MITKKMYAESIINEFCGSEGINRKYLNESYIHQSSKLAVAMEYLGMLKSQESKDYAASRAGTIILHVNEATGKSNILSVRELLDLLPEVL